MSEEISSDYSGRRVFVFTAIYIPVQVIFVALRYLSRYLVRGPWGFDDILIMASLSFQVIMGTITLCMQAVLQVFNGRPFRDLTLQRLNPLGRSRISRALSRKDDPDDPPYMGKISRCHFFAILLDREHSESCNPRLVPSTLPGSKISKNGRHSDRSIDSLDTCDGHHSILGMSAICCQLESQAARFFLY